VVEVDMIVVVQTFTIGLGNRSSAWQIQTPHGS